MGPVVAEVVEVAEPVSLLDQAKQLALGLVDEVLAYAYQWAGGYFRVGVYDPNSPGHDDIYIGLDTANPGRTTAFDHNVNIADPIRGFFGSAYSFSDPSAIAGASLAA